MANNLKDKTRGKDFVVLWLDCDREGEAIGFEVCLLQHLAGVHLSTARV